MTENGDRPRGVHPLKVKAPEKASQTLLSKISDCAYSGALYLKHHDHGAQSHEMARGEAIHAAIETCTNMLIESGEIEMPPEVAKDVMQATLDERTDLVMSPLQHDICRAALWNWGRTVTVDPDRIVGVEIMLELELGGWKIRGKLDRAEVGDNEGSVVDYKSTLAYPDQEAHENDFQQQFYGLLLLEGVPEGETVPLGRGLSGVHLNAHFPRITDDEGHYFTRHAYKDRQQIHDFRRTVEAALAKLDHGLAEGEWKASPGEWCDRCPARRECPLPTEELPPQVATEGQAMEAAERLLVLDNEKKELQPMVRRWVEDNEGFEVGGYRFDLTPQQAEKGDKAAIKAALEEAGLDPDDFFSITTSTRFSKKKVARG